MGESRAAPFPRRRVGCGDGSHCMAHKMAHGSLSLEGTGIMAEHSTTDPQDAAEEHESHELPRGALLITLTYLAVLATLWIQVYVHLLANGGIQGS